MYVINQTVFRDTASMAGTIFLLTTCAVCLAYSVKAWPTFAGRAQSRFHTVSRWPGIHI